MKSAYAPLLNRLDEMQAAPYYATARQTLAEAEAVIVMLEGALQDLVDAYRAGPDGPLGCGLTNGHFLRAEALVLPNAE